MKDLLKLRTTLGNFFNSTLKSALKKLLALKSSLTNLGNAAKEFALAEVHQHWNLKNLNMRSNYTKHRLLASLLQKIY